MSKVTKYTVDELKELEAVYNPEDNEQDRAKAVEDLVELLGRSKTSVIAKLSSMKLYKRPESLKDKMPIVTKDAMVEIIAAKMQLHSEQLPGLEKANKSTLKKIMDSLTEYTAWNTTE